MAASCACFSLANSSSSSLLLWRARRFWNQTATCLGSSPSSAARCTFRPVSSFRSSRKLSSSISACSSLSRRFLGSPASISPLHRAARRLLSRALGFSFPWAVPARKNHQSHACPPGIGTAVYFLREQRRELASSLLEMMHKQLARTYRWPRGGRGPCPRRRKETAGAAAPRTAPCFACSLSVSSPKCEVIWN
jgi:hypothetical protein